MSSETILSLLIKSINTSNKKIVVFGTGKASWVFSSYIGVDNIAYFVDNDSNKHNLTFIDKTIYPPRQLLHENLNNLIVMIASYYYEDISKQLIGLGLEENVNFFNGHSLVHYIPLDLPNAVSITIKKEHAPNLVTKNQNESEIYDDVFFSNNLLTSERAAREIVPLLMDIIKPESVLDVGCGTGIWLNQFQQAGVTDVFGLDGDYVEEKYLVIEKRFFKAHDLKDSFFLNRKFDLVISLEVAEHLPIEHGEAFVESLIQHGTIIVFSAAIPFQGGDNHINEQWQEYWAELFNRRGYRTIDCIRNKVWNNKNVDSWYAQNILVYVKNDVLEKNQRLQIELERSLNSPLSIVHPRLHYDF